MKVKVDMLQHAVLAPSVVLVDEGLLESCGPRISDAVELLVLVHLQINFESETPVLEPEMLAPAQTDQSKWS